MRKSKKWLCVLVAVFTMFSFCTGIYGENVDGVTDNKTLAPYFIIEGQDSSVEKFPLKETSVKANINGVIADIYVTQNYSNEGKEPINASYVFPASTKVSVHGMKMEIGDKVVTAKIKEKQEAKQEFEEAKDAGKSASLLEEQRPNVFSMSVANIMPGDNVRIELHYTEYITSTDGIYEFVFPTVVGPRYSNQSEADATESDKWVKSPYLKDGKTPPGKYEINVNLSTGVPIRDLGCTSHKISVVWNNESSASVALANPEDYAGNRDFIMNYRLAGQKIQSGLMLYQGEEENFFMLTVQPPGRVEQEAIPPREYIFVLDVSGSMEGYPLETAKGLIKNLVSHLRENDKFDLILFSGASEMMSPESVPANSENLKKAIAIIEEQSGGGGTELSPALQEAFSIPCNENFSRSVVAITDGYIDGEKEAFDLINKNIGQANFFSFGIGSSVNRYLIEGMAKTGLGEPFFVTDSSEASGAADRFMKYIQSPVLTDVHIDYNGFETYDVVPSNIPDLFAQRPIVVFGKYRGDPSGSILITGKSGNGEYAQEIPVSGMEPMEANSALRYLWARSRVAGILDYGFGNDNPDVKAEVTKIGLDYSMLTPYTSFIAVIDTIRNTGEKGKDINQPLSLPLHVSNLAVGGGEYEEGSEPDILILAAGALAILAFVILRRKNKREKRCEVCPARLNQP